jgi:hypothetical protein
MLETLIEKPLDELIKLPEKTTSEMEFKSLTSTSLFKKDSHLLLLHFYLHTTNNKLQITLC